MVLLAGVAGRLAEGLGDAVEVNAAEVRAPDGVAPEAEPVRAELERGADVALEQAAMATASELLRSHAKRTAVAVQTTFAVLRDVAEVGVARVHLEVVVAVLVE